MTRRPRSLATPFAILGGLVIASALLLAIPVTSSTAASPAALGVYSCCGYNSCGVLVATAACPSGDTQCTHLPDQGGHAAKCCVNYCNDPHPTEPAPVEPHRP